MDKNFVKLLGICFTFSVGLGQDPSVPTRFGNIIGRQKSVTVQGVEQNVSFFLGIPYAKPPVNDLRFQKPEPIMVIDTPLEAKQFGKFCPQASRIVQDGTEISRSKLVQNGTEYSEDCLFLNIFVPDAVPDSSGGHAVMIWVHGGGFLSDASNEYDATVLAAYGSVIVVTMNYRLGVFGFLSTGDTNAPGNYGLWDQQLAFQWVHENIAAFRGDVRRVTIAGESAGAMSVVLQGYYPQNRDVFHRVIAQSGTPTFSPMDISRDVVKDAQHVGQILGCEHLESTKSLVECLRNKTVNEIYSAVNDGKIDIGRFTPSLDGDFIKTNPYDIPKLSKSRNLMEIEFFRSLDFLNGFNAYEGAVLLYVILKGRVENFIPSRDDLVSKLIPVTMQIAYKQNVGEELNQLVASQYTNWNSSENPSTVRLQFLKLLSDALYAAPAVELTRIHKKVPSAAHTYIYYLTPKPDKQLWFAPSWLPEATHGDDLPLLFPPENKLPDSDTNGPWDIQLSRKLITYWANFVKTGNPNRPVQMTPEWPEYTLEDERYLELEKTMTNSSAQQYLLAEETNFWRELLPDLVLALQKKDGGNKDCDVTNAAKGHSVLAHNITVLILAFLIIIFAC